MTAISDAQATAGAIWRERPARRQRDRTVAGVAAAIGRRYVLDPVLVRIALVVAAFSGIGIPFYLAAWLALPPDPDDPPTGRFAGRGRLGRLVLPVAAGLAGLITLVAVLHGELDLLLAAVVVGGLLVLLHRSRGELGPTGPRTGGPGNGPSGTGTSGTGTSGTGAGEAGTGGREAAGERAAPTPPAWDPLGVAPFAWDLPEPAPAGDVTTRARRSVLTPATIGLALLAGGVTGALALTGSDLGGARWVLGSMLAVVGLGLIVGAVRRTGRGLLVLAVPLALLTWAATAAGPVRWDGVGQLTASPASLTELAPSYRRTVGEITLDLRRALPPTAGPPPGTAPGATPGTALPVPGTGPAAPVVVAAPVRSAVHLAAGQVTVLLPPNLAVRVHCQVGRGSADCLGRAADTRGSGVDLVVDDPGTGSGPGTPVVELDITAGAGDVTVRRG